MCLYIVNLCQHSACGGLVFVDKLTRRGCVIWSLLLLFSWFFQLVAWHVSLLLPHNCTSSTLICFSFLFPLFCLTNLCFFFISSRMSPSSGLYVRSSICARKHEGKIHIRAKIPFTSQASGKPENTSKVTCFSHSSEVHCVYKVGMSRRFYNAVGTDINWIYLA